MKSGNLNFLETTATLQAFSGTDLPLCVCVCIYIYIYIYILPKGIAEFLPATSSCLSGEYLFIVTTTLTTINPTTNHLAFENVSFCNSSPIGSQNIGRIFDWYRNRILPFSQSQHPVSCYVIRDFLLDIDICVLIRTIYSQVRPYEIYLFSEVLRTLPLYTLSADRCI